MRDERSAPTLPGSRLGNWTIFQAKYSSELMHIGAWIAHEQDAPARIGEDSIRQLQLSLESPRSPNSQAILEICGKMLSSLLMLRSGC